MSTNDILFVVTIVLINLSIIFLLVRVNTLEKKLHKLELEKK